MEVQERHHTLTIVKKVDRGVFTQKPLRRAKEGGEEKGGRERRLLQFGFFRKR